jgi:hypothetical protein
MISWNFVRSIVSIRARARKRFGMVIPKSDMNLAIKQHVIGFVYLTEV